MQLLYATLKQEQKTKGKARLTSMLKSGKELKVYVLMPECPGMTDEEAAVVLNGGAGETISRIMMICIT